jgi:hypothetical protein
MESGQGSQELVRIATAYFVSIAFGTTFLVASLAGVDGLTALLRAVLVGAIALVAGRLLSAPVVDVVLAAMARDEARRQAEKPAEDDE